MKVAVCAAPPEMTVGSEEWSGLCALVADEQPDLFLLNELPFGRWISAEPEPSRAALEESVRLHREGLEDLERLSAPAVLGTRPVPRGRKGWNEAFVWTADRGIVPVHTKQYFPDEEGYHEARWFEAGEPRFRTAESGRLQTGFLVCTEVMFNEHARRYGRDGAQVIAVPRAVGVETLPRWKVAVRMAAIVSGCYVLSSNRVGTDSRGQTFGGHGWIVSPRGEVLAETTADLPVVSADLDPGLVSRAQRRFPCYVPEYG